MKVAYVHPLLKTSYEIDVIKSGFTVSKGGTVIHTSAAVRALDGELVSDEMALVIAKAWVNLQ